VKLNVVSPFIDKHTNVYYKEGAVYETDSAERGEELQKNGFLGEQIETTVEKNPTPKPKNKKDAQ
jgi:hypothetical protein